MKKISILLVAFSAMISCKKATTTPEKKEVSPTPVEETIVDRSKDFPEDIQAVFKAHGGIQAFDQQQTLVFELSNPEGNEKHTTDLKSRHAHIETDKFVMGFDGEKAWIFIIISCFIFMQCLLY